MQNKQINQQKTSLQKLKIQESLQEAQVTLFEKLYKNEIDWKTMESHQNFVIALTDPLWKANIEFSKINEKEDDQIEKMITPNTMNIAATITLIHKDQLLKNPTNTLTFCCVKDASS